MAGEPWQTSPDQWPRDHLHRPVPFFAAATPVRVELTETSQPLTYEAENTYTKGGLFCVLTISGEVHKFPLANVWRIVEGYGRRTDRQETA